MKITKIIKSAVPMYVCHVTGARPESAVVYWFDRATSKLVGAIAGSSLKRLQNKDDEARLKIAKAMKAKVFHAHAKAVKAYAIAKAELEGLFRGFEAYKAGGLNEGLVPAVEFKLKSLARAVTAKQHYVEKLEAELAKPLSEYYDEALGKVQGVVDNIQDLKENQAAAQALKAKLLAEIKAVTKVVKAATTKDAQVEPEPVEAVSLETVVAPA